MKEIIRKFLNKRGYDIIKLNGTVKNKKYPNLSKNKEDYYCETPVGNYYLPVDAEKDGVADAIKRGNLFETENIEIAKRYIKKGSTVLDIGANFGQMSVQFSNLVGEKGTVYAFEAQDKVFEYLKKNITANGRSNIIAKDGAVYNEDNKILIFPEPDINEPNAYGGNAINPTLKTGREVKTFTIDSLQITTPVSFMKIDIQGADLFAMQGAKETILKNKMPVFFEFEQQFQDQFQTVFQDYVDFVNEIGYKFAETVSGINYLILPK